MMAFLHNFYTMSMVKILTLLPAARRDAVALPRFALTRWPAARRDAVYLASRIP